VIAKFIEKRGEGIHHIAFEVEDIEAEMESVAG
jgi:methylmalonyl-CoA/ethylmalonyl-CoA epimerase